MHLKVKHSPEYTKRRIAAGALAAGIGYAAFLGLHSNSAETNSKVHNDRIAALANADQKLNGDVVLDAGTQVRTLPEIAEGTPDALDTWGNDFSDEAFKVPSGRHLVVKGAIRSTDNPDWIGFIQPGTKAGDLKTLAQRAEHTVWVEEGALIIEGYAHENLNPEEPYLSFNGDTDSAYGQALMQRGDTHVDPAPHSSELMSFHK